MNTRKFGAILLAMFAVFLGAVYVLGVVYPRTFTIASYSVAPASAQVQALVSSSTEADIPVIVTLKRPNVFSTFTVSPQAFVVAATEDFERTYGFETRNQMFEFEMVSGTIPRENLYNLARDSRVRGVWYDQVIRVPDVDFSSLYEEESVTIDEARQGLGLDKLGTGKGVSVVAIDSGAAPQLVQYDEVWGVTDDSANDRYGHGTLVSWIIKSLAPDCDLYSIKVLGADGMGRASDVIAGIETALREVPRPMVINLSLGMSSSVLDPLAESAGAAVCWNNSVYIFAACGNAGHGVVLSPAISDSVVAVGAVGRDLEYLSFSGGGTVGGRIKPDVVSYGVVYGPWLGEWKVSAGTSIATPMAAATFADWLSMLEDPNDIDAVRTAAVGGVDLGVEGPDTYYGVGGFLSGDVLAQTEGVERETPQSRLVVALPLVVLSCVPAVVIWRERR